MELRRVVTPELLFLFGREPSADELEKCIANPHRTYTNQKSTCVHGDVATIVRRQWKMNGLQIMHERLCEIARCQRTAHR